MRRLPAVTAAHLGGTHGGHLRRAAAVDPAGVQMRPASIARSAARPADATAWSGGARRRGCVVPVPLHWRRRWQRGFNQALDLARELGMPVHCALRRRGNARTQTDLPADARLRNVRDAFVVSRRDAHFWSSHRAGGRRQHHRGGRWRRARGCCVAAGAAEVRTLTTASSRASARDRLAHIGADVWLGSIAVS